MQLSSMGFGSLRLVVLVCSLYCCFGQSQLSAKQLPRTVDEAVSVLESELTPSMHEYLLRTPREVAQAKLHMSVGMGIRNRFKLWGGNSELMKSCGVRHPDSCSGIILGKLWDAVRAQAEPERIRQLDCQFELAEAIHINYRGFDRVTTGQLLQSLERQINEQMSQLKSSRTPLCQSSLTLHVIGDPKLDCFVRAEFAHEDHEDKVQEVTLERLLGWIGWRNDFEAVHDPPTLTLNFRNKCAWTQPPRF